MVRAVPADTALSAPAAVMVGDKIAFKSMYGFLTGSPEGIGAHTYATWDPHDPPSRPL
jgi:hypothetical protein